MKCLLESDRIKVNINLQDRRGWTALHEACKSGRRSTVEYLMELDYAHVDVNIRDNDGNTPMHTACKAGHQDIVEYFMRSDQSDVDINARNNKGQTLLHLACKSGNRDLVEHLIDSDRIHFIMEDNDGNNLLHHACKRGRTDVLEYLVQCHQVDVNTNINKQNNNGDTPLHVAFEFMGMDMNSLRYLLELDDAGAAIDLNIRNGDGDTLLHLACNTHWYDGGDLISYVVECGKFHTGSHIRTQNNDGDTPIHLLCTHRHFDILPNLEMLMEVCRNNNNNDNKRGIDEILKIQNSRGNTPLHVACEHQEHDIIEYLLQSHKANDSLGEYIQNHDGSTPLHIAFGRGLFDTFNDTAIITRLFDFIQHQVIPTTNLSDLSHPNNHMGDTAILQRLIEEAKPVANIQNRHGTTLLHLACIRRESGLSTLQQLVGRDSVDATLQDSDGDTALHYICKANNDSNYLHEFHDDDNDGDDNDDDDGDHDDDQVERMKLLIDSSNVKVDVNLPNKDGDTVLHCAVKGNCFELVEYLMTLEEIDPHVQNRAGDTALEYAQRDFRSDAKILALLESSRLADDPDHPAAKRNQVTVPAGQRRPKY